MRNNKLLHNLNRSTFHINALKVVALLTLIGATSYQTYVHKNKLSRTSVTNEIKTETLDTKTQQTMTDEAADEFIAIFYHDNGDISLFINQEVLPLATAIEKYPAQTEGIREYIAATHKPTQNTTESSAVNNLEK